MGRDLNISSVGLTPKCFNPRARMGRDVVGCLLLGQVLDVSTHAPAWGATLRHPAGTPLRPCFNPRARMGRDRPDARSDADGRVSTHAPAWGATAMQQSPMRTVFQFQPTRPHGARQSLNIRVSPEAMFQPTRPHGARPALASRVCVSLMFQPTRPHGARRPAPLQCWRQACFNPRARMGRDSLTLLTLRPRSLFQPTRPHGARHLPL